MHLQGRVTVVPRDPLTNSLPELASLVCNSIGQQVVVPTGM